MAPVPPSTPVDAPRAVLVVDAANVVGSRPDGWWRDRAGATGRLIAGLALLPGRTLATPGGPLTVEELTVVVEGAGRDVDDPDTPGLRLVRAEHDGDSALAALVATLTEQSRRVLVVTADRGLRARVSGAGVVGPAWLWSVLDDLRRCGGQMSSENAGRAQR